ncbi:MAG: transposase [Planctomycetes bacterium]|nr:transposase [Planctomycetota bacterium]
MPNNIQVRQGSNLPHWTSEGATYFVTFRLADSLPKSAIQKLRAEAALLDNKLAMSPDDITPEELIRRAKLKSDAYLKLLDAGFGACVLRRDDVAKVVSDALNHFDGRRYELFAWCVMPNHVHVVFRPIADFELPGILHSWKSFTAKQANRLLGRTGAFWQSESYDHLVRDEHDFAHAVSYTLENPAAAGLRDWKWVGAKEGLG